MIVWEDTGWLIPAHSVEEAGEERQVVSVVVAGEHLDPSVATLTVVDDLREAGEEESEQLLSVAVVLRHLIMIMTTQLSTIIIHLCHAESTAHPLLPDVLTTINVDQLLHLIPAPVPAASHSEV